MESYKTNGVCAVRIDFGVRGGIVEKVSFTGACSGNAQGVSRLVEGMSAEEAVKRLRGIKCGNKDTSCPDQLAKALEKYL